MRKLTEEQAGLLEQILEAGIKAVTGENIPVTVNLPEREPEYEYVTDGKTRALIPGDWYFSLADEEFRQIKHHTSGSFVPFRRIKKKP
mgnify:CR=1 FL=1